MTVLAFLTERASVKKVLEHLGLPTTGPPIANPAHAGQEGLDLARDSLRRWARHKGFRMPRTGLCFSRTKARGYTKVTHARLIRPLRDALQQPEWGLRAASPRPK